MNLMNLIKVMNFSRAEETINFSVIWFTRRVEGLLANALDDGFLPQLTGKSTQERNRPRVSSRTEGDYAGDSCPVATRMIAAM
jgi:hypothetical protein